MRLNWVESDLMGELHARKLELLNQGNEVIDLSMINPDIPPSRLMLDKLMEATVRPVNHRYAVARGIRKLREAIAIKYKNAWEVQIDPESQVCATMGSKDAIEHVLMCLAADGDSVLMGIPAYPAFVSAALLARLKPTFFEISSDESVMLESISKAVAHHNPKILLLNFPNNPTGIAVSRDFYIRLADILGDRDIHVVNDFVYGEMMFDGSPGVSLLSVEGLKGRASEIYSMSKAYSVPGWRIGSLVGDPGLIARMAALKAHIDYGIFLPLQYAAAACLTSDLKQVKVVTEQYKERSQLLCDGLRRRGWTVRDPDAGCSVWCKMPKSAKFTEQFATDLLNHGQIAVLPGAVFGGNGLADGALSDRSNILDGMIRLALVQPVSRLRAVLDRIDEISFSGSPETCSLA